jgi:pyruvate formate lyase activating enzyme
VHSKVVAANVDPIEKKPLFHFHPGTLSFSVASVGCNMHCLHCQNAEISQMPFDRGKIEGRALAPEEAVSAALAGNCRSISFTYTEPTVYFEYAYDTARKAAEAGLENVFVTNGYIEVGPLEAIGPWLHGANVDLKSFRDSFYRRVCRARLAPVLDTLKRMRSMGIWIEVTTLLIPGRNDEEEELRDIAQFLRDLGEDIPWHVSAYYPTYKMTDRPRTPLKTLRRAWEIGREEGLLFVYTGNVPGDEAENTTCPQCGTCVIRRHGFQVLSMDLEHGRCHQCKREVPGRFG